MAEDFSLNMGQELPDISTDANAALDMDAAMTQAQNAMPELNTTVAQEPPAFGQPSAPTRPGQTPPNDFKKAMEKSLDADINYNFIDKYKPAPGELTLPGPKMRYAGKDVDLYRFQEDFDPQGFDPFNEKNYEHWAAKEDWSSALGKGFDSFATRFGNTYVDSFASYGRIGEALFNWDFSKLMPDEAQMMEQNWAEYKESMKNFVFVPPEQEEDIFSKRTVSEFIGNAGFALGTFGALATELVADAALTYVTGGGAGGSFAATLAKFGAREAAVQGAKVGLKETVKRGAFRFADFMADVGQGAGFYANQSADALSAGAKVSQKANQAKVMAEAGKTGSDALRNTMKEVFDIYTLNARNIVKSKSFAELAGNVAKGVPLVGTGIRYGEKIAAGVKGGLSTGKLVGIGLQGTRRIVQEYNMASTEAGFEAVTTYGATLDLMVDNYRKQHNGENPPPEEFAKMQSKAMDASSANYKTNTALLLATNRLQFGGIFNRYLGSNKFIKELTEEGVENTLGVNRAFKSSQLLGKTYSKGFFGTYGLAGQIAKDFGKKQAIYEMGKAFLKDVGKFEISEGIQENLQETSAEGWKNYYAGQYNGTKYTLSNAFEKGLDEQFTRQGFRTFLQGAITGSLIRPATAMTSKLTTYINEKAIASNYKNNPNDNPIIQMKERLKRDLDLQNEMMAQMSRKKFEDNVVSFTAQVDATLQQTEAAAKNSQYEWQNGKDNSVLAGALAANRTGTILVYQQALREMGKSMSNEEFEKSLNVKLEDTKYGSAAEFGEAMATDVKKYSDIIDGIRRKIKNQTVDPYMYEAGSKDRLIATITQIVQEDAIKIVAANALKATRASERVQSVTQEMLAIPGLANSAEFAMRVMANPQNIQSEIGNIKAEVKILQESLSVVDASQKENIKEKIKDKTRELELIDKWLNFWESRDVVLEREDSETKEKVERKEKVYDTFVGMPFVGQQVDKDGNVIKEEKMYSEDHADIVNTLREFINLRNKQAGIPDQISEQSVRDFHRKLIDFMKLNRDAKDYMEAMDVLYNPEYYKQTLERMKDGRFKYELIEFVDGLNQRLRQILFFTISNSQTQDQFEIVALMKTVWDQLSNAVFQSEAYKNLQLIAVDPDTGLQHSKFAKENADKLNEIIQEEIDKLIEKFAPEAATNEISDADYENFLKTKKVSKYILTGIARKIQQQRELTKRQQEVYDANKDAIDEIFQRIKNTTEPGAKTESQDVSIVGAAKEKLVATGDFTKDDLSLLTSAQILDLALERNLITAEDIEKHKSTLEPISDEVYNRFIQSQDVDVSILDIIAQKDFEGLTLSPREQAILEAKSAEIQELQEQMEQLEENQKNTNVVTDTQQVTKSDVATQNDQPDDTNQKTGDNLPPPSSSDDDFLLQNMGPGLANTDDKGNTKDASEPFEVKGGTDTGFNVESKDGINVNETTIKSEEEANQMALNMNNGRKDLDWATKFIGPIPDGDESVTDVISRMIARGNKSLQAYNKNRENKIQTLQEYYTYPEGKEALDAIRESILTNTPLADVKAKRKKAKNKAGEQIDLFESTSTPSKTGPAVTIETLTELDREIKNLMQDFGSEIAKTSMVQTILYEDLNVTSKVITDVYLNGMHYVETADGRFYVVPDPSFYPFIGFDTYAREVSREEIIKPFRTPAEWKEVREKYGVPSEKPKSETEIKEMSENFSKFVGEDVVTEDMITDQMKQLGTCFK